VGMQEEEAAGDVQGDQVALVVPPQVMLVVFSQRRAQVTAWEQQACIGELTVCTRTDP